MAVHGGFGLGVMTKRRYTIADKPRDGLHIVATGLPDFTLCMRKSYARGVKHIPLSEFALTGGGVNKQNACRYCFDRARRRLRFQGLVS